MSDFHQAHHVLHRFRQDATHGVDHADRIRRRFLHQAGEQIGEIFLAGARGVVREIDHVHAAGLGVVDHADALLQHVFPGPFELVFELGIADRDLDNHAVAAAFQRLVDIGVHGAGEGVDLRLQPQLRNFLDGLEILLGDGGHAGLDAIHADFGQLLGNRHFVGDAENHSRRLLAIAQRGVVNAHARGKLEFRRHFRNEIIGTDPPLIFSIVFAVHVCQLYHSRPWTFPSAIQPDSSLLRARYR